MHLPRFLLAALCAALCVTSAAQSAAPTPLRLAGVFGDNMVLQRGAHLPVWGWAPPGSRVTVRFLGSRAVAKAGDDGRWRAKLGSQQPGGPFELSVECEATSLTLHNVMVGDVWLCSGQSNMAMALGLVKDGPAEVAAADHPGVRLLAVSRRVGVRPADDIGTSGWKVCTPDTATSFSAVAYLFGRDLHRHTGVPVGLVHASWGGTPVESWMSEEALAALPRWRDRIRDLERPDAGADSASLAAAHRARMAAWERIVDERDPGNAGETWAAPGHDDSDWETMALPGSWDTRDLPTYDGTVWFRRTVEIPEQLLGQNLRVVLSDADDDDRTYVNGHLVGSTRGFGKVRRYAIPPGVARAGTNQVTVRVLDFAAGGGISGDPAYLRVDATDSSGTITIIPLAGEWRWRRGVELTDVPHRPVETTSAMRLAGLYNGMIRPLAPVALKGVIWYQGESNAPRAAQYRALFPAMIRDWRRTWDAGALPFLFVQLPEFLPADPRPVDSSWAELREAQAMALELPRTGMAVTLGLGNPDDIHPLNKQDVAARLVRLARHVAYGEQDVVPCGPLYRRDSARHTGDGWMRLRFVHTGAGLRARGGELRGFALAGEDRVFHWADETRIEGNDTVLVRSAAVPRPVAVRYAWHSNPDATLENSEALPAGPFRTDDWPGVTDRF